MMRRMPLATSSLPPMFSLLALMLVAVVGVSLLLLRLRQSLLVAYFLCGIAIANTGLMESMAGEGGKEAIDRMSEFGVMWLLFVIGMDFSLKELRHLQRYAFQGGAAQMALSMAAAGAATWAFFGFDWPQVVVVAVACALSSTAISVKLYQDMGIAASSGARLALGVAIFQDLFIIAFLVLLPALFPATGVDGGSTGTLLVFTLAKGIAFVGISWLLAKHVIPRVLHAVATTRSRELFTLTVAGLCIGVAYLAALMDLSLILGAFVAGVAVSECMYKHRIVAEVGPFKDLFLTMFFVSVGLGIDLAELAGDWLLVLSIILLLILGKTLLVGLIARLLGLNWRAAVVAGIGLGSAGEFSLVLMSKTSAMTEWANNGNEPLLAAMALSMAMVPVLMRFAPVLSDWLEKNYPTLWQRRRRVENLPRGSDQELSDHAVICGYGPVGQQLAKALWDQGVPTLVIDLNAETVRQLQTDGQPALFADASQPEVWNLSNITQARLVAFTFPATPAVVTAMHLIRERNPAIAILVRAAFTNDALRLADAGADIVVQDEQETARATVNRTLAVLHLEQGKKDPDAKSEQK